MLTKHQLKALEAIKQNFNTLVTTCKTTRSRSQILNNLGSVALQFSSTSSELAGSQVKALRQTTKVLSISLSELATGIETREVSLSDLRQTLTRLQNKPYQNYLKAYATAAQRAVDVAHAEGEETEVVSPREAKKKIRISLASVDHKEQLAQIKDILRKQHQALDPTAEDAPPIHPSDVELMRVFERAAQEKKNIPKRVNTPYVIIRAPIIPMFDTAMYDNVGMKSIPHTWITEPSVNRAPGTSKLSTQRNAYVLLEDQILLGIPHSKAEQAHLHALDYAKETLKLINARSKNKYVVASDYSMGRPITFDDPTRLSKRKTLNDNLLLFWILPEPIYNALRKGTHGGHLSVNKWGFPWTDK